MTNFNRHQRPVHPRISSHARPRTSLRSPPVKRKCFGSYRGFKPLVLLDQQVRLEYIAVCINTHSRQRQRRPLHSFHPPSLPKRLCDLMHSELAAQNESGERHGQIFKEIPPSVQRCRCSTYTPLTPFSFGYRMISTRYQNPNTDAKCYIPDPCRDVHVDLAPTS